MGSEMERERLSLTLLPETLAVCRLDAADPVPGWAAGGTGFWSITRGADELSVICPESAVPPGARCERGFRAFRVEGPLPFEAVGILASLAAPLAEAGISLLAISTYDTDYLLVREGQVTDAQRILSQSCDLLPHPTANRTAGSPRIA
jgi:uncharacterized protein